VIALAGTTATATAAAIAASKAVSLRM
jgi:hypothetical protein